MIVKLGANVARSSRGGPAEQVAGEDAGPGRLGVDAEAPAVRLVGADVQVLRVQRAVLEVAHEARAEPVVVLLADLVVDLAPPDLVLAPRLADDELVLRRSAGVLAGPDDERALGRDRPLPSRMARSYSSAMERLASTRAADRSTAGWALVMVTDRYLDCGAGVTARRAIVDRPRVTGAARESASAVKVAIRFPASYKVAQPWRIAHPGQMGLRLCAGFGVPERVTERACPAPRVEVPRYDP